ncbi:juvenile hormone esterase-like [Lutzomyia longipalpis]|uniref:juvenile hormone esterase-like n=1 Tax=Lutzomyia longipalpis TaxID=7200 RepID=UPI002483D60B|nr:juvenile hormone esterase-like [Lutzomyia longipalpis]
MRFSFFVFSLIFANYFNYSISQKSPFFSRNFFREFLRKSSNSKSEVCAKAGCVRGKVESGRVKPYEAFYGIPYAEPPVGKLRFENPVPYAGWKGYWDATYPRDGCLQKNIFIYTLPISGSEDCLYLNVYRPVYRKKDEKMPVVIYFSAGSWLSFSSNPSEFGPEYLMDNGEVILVTFNYRLGMFGLLCSGDEAVKGNFALKDQQIAMKWVVDNIEYFGGDANSITLLGYACGAASIHLHMMNPISQALFQRAVLMSGSAISPWTLVRDFKTQFRQSAQYVGLNDWDTASTFELAYQLKKVDALSLLTAVDNFFVFVATPPAPFTPCIEGNWEGAFLTEDPRVLWAEGRYFPKPVIIGSTTNEGVLGAVVTRNETLLPILNENLYTFLPILLNFPPRYMAEVLKYYFGDNDVIDSSNERQFFQVITDRLFVYPQNSFVNQFISTADIATTPIYIYEFDFKSQYTYLRTFTGQDINLGVCHMDDLFYLFTMKEFIPEFDTTSPEGRMVDVFVRTMVNFAARGEIKDWRRFKPCTPATSTPSCDRQLFLRFKKEDPNQVMVSVTNEIDTEMIKLWSRIDNGINAITQNCN